MNTSKLDGKKSCNVEFSVQWQRQRQRHNQTKPNNNYSIQNLTATRLRFKPKNSTSKGIEIETKQTLYTRHLSHTYTYRDILWFELIFFSLSCFFSLQMFIYIEMKIAFCGINSMCMQCIHKYAVQLVWLLVMVVVVVASAR